MAYRLKSVLKGSTIYTGGQVLTKATGFVLIPLYTRFLTTDDYGIIGVVNVIVAMMSMALMFGVYPTQTRLYYDFKGDKNKIGELLFTLNCFMVVVVTAVCILLTFFGEPLFRLFIKNESIGFYPFIVIGIWTVFFNIINQLVTRYYATTRKYAFSALIQFVLFLITTGSIIFFVVYRKEGALGPIKGGLIGQAVVFGVFYWPYARRFAARFNFEHIKSLMSFGMPVVIHLTAATVMTSIDRIILEKYLPLSSVGIYTLGCQLGSAISIIVVSINRAWMPNYYDLMDSKDVDRAYEIRRIFCVWQVVIGAMCLVGGLWARDVVALLATDRYYDAAGIMPIILLGYFFNGVYFFMISPIFHYKKTSRLPLITISAAVMNVVLNLILIPRQGTLGAANAMMLSFLSLAVLSYFIGKRYFNPHFEIARLTVLAIIVSIPSMLLNFGHGLTFSVVYKILVVAGYITLCYVFFRSYFDPVIRRIYSHAMARAGKENG